MDPLSLSTKPKGKGGEKNFITVEFVCWIPSEDALNKFFSFHD